MMSSCTAPDAIQGGGGRARDERHPQVPQPCILSVVAYRTGASVPLTCRRSWQLKPSTLTLSLQLLLPFPFFSLPAATHKHQDATSTVWAPMLPVLLYRATHVFANVTQSWRHTSGSTSLSSGTTSRSRASTLRTEKNKDLSCFTLLAWYHALKPVRSLLRGVRDTAT